MSVTAKEHLACLARWYRDARKDDAAPTWATRARATDLLHGLRGNLAAFSADTVARAAYILTDPHVMPVELVIAVADRACEELGA